MRPEQLGPYRIVRSLGRGGMGTVYEGVNLETDEPAAIKILAAALAQEPDFRQRFEVEIETLKKLYHPNIVQLFGFGEQDGHLFYAMELVDGNSLEEELRQGRAFDWRETARIGIDVCRALRHAHDRGIVHRDIKPANLLMAKDGRIKLSDFGIARLFGNTRLTLAGNVLGTAEYMAPEQAEGRSVSPRADLYSLGGVLFCLLSRRSPFRAKSLIEMLEKHRSAPPEAVSKYAPETPLELERIILQLLEKDPEKRIANATIVSRRLAAMLHALSVRPDSAEREAMDRLAQEGGQTRIRDQPPPMGETGQDDESQAPEQAGTHSGASPDSVPGGRTVTHMLGKSFSLRSTATHAVRPIPEESEAGVGQPSPSMAETQPTAAFNEYRDAGQGAGIDSSGQHDVTQSGRFVAITQEDLDAFEPTEASPHALISLHTWILASALLSIGLIVWYFVQPPTANALYGKITRITQSRSAAADRTAALVDAEPLIQEFSNRYSDDSRAPILREDMRKIELYWLERQLKNRSKKTEDLLPIERAYLEAINHAAIDPEEGLRKLQAIVDLYQDRTDLSGPAGRCLELVRRRYDDLRQQIDTFTIDSIAEVEERLCRAEEVYPQHPEKARAMWQAIVEIYDRKPWAVEAVAEAQAVLAAHPAKPASPEAAESKP